MAQVKQLSLDTVKSLGSRTSSVSSSVVSGDEPPLEVDESQSPIRPLWGKCSDDIINLLVSGVDAEGQQLLGVHVVERAQVRQPQEQFGEAW